MDLATILTEGADCPRTDAIKISKPFSLITSFLLNFKR
jgi:hypothetical protein